MCVLTQYIMLILILGCVVCVCVCVCVYMCVCVHVCVCVCTCVCARRTVQVDAAHSVRIQGVATAFHLTDVLPLSQ